MKEATAEELITFAQTHGFQEFTAERLQYMVDQGLLAKQPSGKYVMTAKGSSTVDAKRLREKYQTAIEQVLYPDYYTVHGKPVKGQALSHAVRHLRDYPHRLEVPGRYGDQIKLFEILGFKVDHGLNGRNQKCEVVYRDEV